MKIRLATPVLMRDSIVDGEGIRTVIWTQGCSHKCPGCHNPQTHSFDDGFELDIEEVKEEIDALEGQDGITFSGGDPMFQVDAFTELAKMVKERTNKTIWMYTGFVYESIIKDAKMSQILPFIDVLVDGPYKDELRDTSLRFRGSSNQRIIELKNGIAQNIS
jgi:anaerobic ribonucleoside-triphosphate reductase activating protein